MARRVDDPSVLLAAAHEGDARATSRLISIAERGGEPASELASAAIAVAVAAVDSGRVGRGAHIVGITGAPGAGKSTVVGALARRWAGAGRRVAVLAIDPSSPLSGGAILGDRVRMDGNGVDPMPEVFIRSMATRGHHGGLAMAVPGALRVLDAIGFDMVLVETAGIGQIELAIVGVADTTVLVLTPNAGDAVQATKAGVMEIADVFAVNKADRPGAAEVVRDVRAVLQLGGRGAAAGWTPPVVPTSAIDGTGVDALLEAIDSHLIELDATGERALRRSRRLREELGALARGELDAALDVALDDEALLAAVRDGNLPIADAVRMVVDRVRTMRP